ncbi:MAG: RICIN domain-containing protein [Tenuifilaceae bacterium]|jgi:hypothetical protein|nr:RICIN domain-containing protein [Tenuifilaceae bacterium]
MKRAFTLLIVSLLAIASVKAQTPSEVPIGPGTRFHIQSAMNFGKNNGGYWDVPGVFQPNMSISRGSNIQVYDLDVHHDRYFTFYPSSVPGYYEIQVGLTNETRIDIQGAKGPGTPNGSNVQVWDRTDLTNQRFMLHHMGNGRFKIYDQNSGKILCLKGRSNANRTNVHLWDDHNGSWVEWYLIDVKTKKAFVPAVSKNPDFFIKNKNFKYKSGSMVSRSEGTATVESISGNKITIRIMGTNYNSDVPPGHPTETNFDRKIEITYQNGQYIYIPDIFNSGEISSDGNTLSFSGDAYMELTVDNSAKGNAVSRPSQRQTKNEAQGTIKGGRR